jgi:Protein of unknown function (DUF3489)
VIDVLIAVATAQGDFTMSTPNSEETALQAAPASQNPEPTPETKTSKTAGKPKSGAQSAKGAPAKTKVSKKSIPPKKAPKPRKNATAAKPADAREGSKTAIVLALIQRAKGATLAEIMEATSWQAHSVRGFISGTLGKKMGLKVKSAKREDGARFYSLPK